MNNKKEDAEIGINRFRVIRKDAVRKLGTGIAEYIFNCLKYFHRKDLESDAIEFVWLEIKSFNP